jgi:hypothetical protein
MPGRNAVPLALLMLCSACGAIRPYNETNGTATFPDSKVALIDQYSDKGFVLNGSRFSLRYLDGKPYIPSNSTWHDWGRVIPGRHTLGVWSNWGDVCPIIPIPFLVDRPHCPNLCYSGMVLNAEAGRKYGYAIEKNKNEAYVVVSDETGTVAAKGLCEKYSHPAGPSQDQVMKSVNERLERESKEPEIQDKAQ